MSRKYYVSKKDAKQNLKMMFPMLMGFLVMAFYSTGYRNEAVRIFMIALPLATVLLFVFIYVTSIVPGLTFYQLDLEGMHVRRTFLFKKTIKWKDVDTIGKASLGRIEVIGVMYKPSFTKYVFGRKTRKRISGWDELISSAYSTDGKSFIVEARKMFNTSRKHKAR
jgi:hypothetical protein